MDNLGESVFISFLSDHSAVENVHSPHSFTIQIREVLYSSLPKTSDHLRVAHKAKRQCDEMEKGDFHSCIKYSALRIARWTDGELCPLLDCAIGLLL